MPIRFSCACGRALKVADEHAGKKTKCTACGAVIEIPKPEVEELEVEEIEVEVVEDEPAAKRKPDRDDDSGERPRRRKRRRPDRGGALARMYEAEGRRQEELYQGIARAADSSWGRREDEREGHGWTMFGVHLTAGVISGASMLLVGLLCMVLIMIFKDDEEVTLGPRIFIGAILLTGMGLLVLAKSIFFGEED